MVTVEHTDAPLHVGKTVAAWAGPSLGQYRRDTLENLVSNAVRSTDAGGTIEITATSSTDRITLAVRDSGVGIPAGEIERIFDPFLRGTGSRREDGRGLGLAVVKRVIESHGWSIGVSSTAGEGDLISSISVEEAAAVLGYDPALLEQYGAHDEIFRTLFNPDVDRNGRWDFEEGFETRLAYDQSFTLSRGYLGEAGADEALADDLLADYGMQLDVELKGYQAKLGGVFACDLYVDWGEGEIPLGTVDPEDAGGAFDVVAEGYHIVYKFVVPASIDPDHSAPYDGDYVLRFSDGTTLTFAGCRLASGIRGTAGMPFPLWRAQRNDDGTLENVAFEWRLLRGGTVEDLSEDLFRMLLMWAQLEYFDSAGERIGSHWFVDWNDPLLAEMSGTVVFDQAQDARPAREFPLRWSAPRRLWP